MAKAKPDDGRVAEHQGRPIFLDTEEGFFYAARDPKEPVHRDNMVRAQALPALKKKLDDLIRSRARLEAGGLELVARVVHDYYWRHRDDEENDRDDEWIAGRYDGVNAHRGEVYLRLPGGERREVTGGYLFIAGDPVIPVPVLGSLRPHFEEWCAFDTGLVHGLAQVRGERLDLVAIVAHFEGQGDVGRFLAACQAAYQLIYIWEIVNPVLAGMPERRGFQPCPDLVIDRLAMCWHRAAGRA